MARIDEPPYWLVWGEDGPAPTMKHTSPEAAENEARRLALMHSGKSFVVLSPLTRYTHTALTVENFSMDAYVPF